MKKLITFSVNFLVLSLIICTADAQETLSSSSKATFGQRVWWAASDSITKPSVLLPWIVTTTTACALPTVRCVAKQLWNYGVSSETMNFCAQQWKPLAGISLAILGSGVLTACTMNIQWKEESARQKNAQKFSNIVDLDKEGLIGIDPGSGQLITTYAFESTQRTRFVTYGPCSYLQPAKTGIPDHLQFSLARAGGPSASEIQQEWSKWRLMQWWRKKRMVETIPTLISMQNMNSSVQNVLNRQDLPDNYIVIHPRNTQIINGILNLMEFDTTIRIAKKSDFVSIFHMLIDNKALNVNIDDFSDAKTLFNVTMQCWPDEWKLDMVSRLAQVFKASNNDSFSLKQQFNKLINVKQCVENLSQCKESDSENLRKAQKWLARAILINANTSKLLQFTTEEMKGLELVVLGEIEKDTQKNKNWLKIKEKFFEEGARAITYFIDGKKPLVNFSQSRTLEEIIQLWGRVIESVSKKTIKKSDQKQEYGKSSEPPVKKKREELSDDAKVNNGSEGSSAEIMPSTVAQKKWQTSIQKIENSIKEYHAEYKRYQGSSALEQSPVMNYYDEEKNLITSNRDRLAKEFRDHVRDLIKVCLEAVGDEVAYVSTDPNSDIGKKIFSFISSIALKNTVNLNELVTQMIKELNEKSKVKMLSQQECEKLVIEFWRKASEKIVLSLATQSKHNI